MAIKTIRSKKLKLLCEKNDDSKIEPNHRTKVRRIISTLHASHNPKDLHAFFGAGFSEKKGDAEGVYSIEVNGNWRITFEIEHDGAVVVDYCDYHGKKIRKK